MFMGGYQSGVVQARRREQQGELRGEGGAGVQIINLTPGSQEKLEEQKTKFLGLSFWLFLAPWLPGVSLPTFRNEDRLFFALEHLTNSAT
jgi:hypothetical protein